MNIFITQSLPGGHLKRGVSPDPRVATLEKKGANQWSDYSDWIKQYLACTQRAKQHLQLTLESFKSMGVSFWGL